MEEQIETHASPQQVWRIWERAHGIFDEKKKSKYKIINIKKGESFSIIWKGLFVRMVFNHKVLPTKNGSIISYDVQIKGLFAWPIRRFVGEKIRKNLQYVLKAIANELESQSIV